jgi:hypothetical protein
MNPNQFRRPFNPHMFRRDGINEEKPLRSLVKKHNENNLIEYFGEEEYTFE